MRSWLNMMTKEKLKRYRALVKEIEILETKACIVHDTVKGSSRHFPYIEQSFKIEGLPSSRFQNRIDRSKRLQKEIVDWIDGIKDPEIRIIMEMRYLWGSSWFEISMALGGNCEDYARKKHDRFLE